MKNSVSSKVSAFYKKLVKDAVNNVPSFSGFTSRDVHVVGNSKDYPNSVVISCNDLYGETSRPGFVLVEYDATGKFIKSYAATQTELMKAYSEAAADGVNILCDFNGPMSRKDRLDGQGELVRIPWTYLENYSM